MYHQSGEDFDDPFVQVKSDVQEGLTEVNALLDRWHNLTNARPEESSRLITEISNRCKEITEDLNELSNTIMVVEAKRSNFPHITDAELADRKRFIETSRRQLHEAKDAMKGYRPKAQKAQRQQLFSGSNNNNNSNSNTGGYHIIVDTNDLHSTDGSSNDEFIHDQYRKQEMIMRRQDEDVDELLNSVSRVRTVAGQINDELTSQAELLEEVEEEMTTTEKFIRTTQKQLNKLLKSSKTSWGFIAVLSIVAVVLIVLLFFVV